MSGSIFGTLFKITTWGESHGKALGVVIDGCPAGIALCNDDIQKELERRKPGNFKYATKRNEDDSVDILSGVFEGKTTGTPISLIIYNNDQRSRDYSDIADCYRPGHADFTYTEKYGMRDYRGGGRSSGRETAARVAAGAVAKKILHELHIDITAYTYSIGNIKINTKNFQKEEILNNAFCMPDADAALEASQYLDEIIKCEDSVGGIIECCVSGLKAGIGEPVFDKLDASISKAIMSLGATKGIEFGLGFAAASLKGSENNDGFYVDEDHQVKKYSNHAGGILGGMSDGSDILFRAVFKPTPSIHKTQKTVNGKTLENIEININGRHDPIIVPRAVVVVEAMTAITIVDHLFQNLLSKIDTIKKIY